MTNYVAPSLELEAFTCPHCSAYAKHDKSGLLWYSPGGSGFNNSASPLYVDGPLIWGEPESDWDQEESTWNIARCQACNGKSLFKGHEFVYPNLTFSFVEPHEDMPEEAKNLYLEASQVYGVSRRAAAALLRAATESLLKHLTLDIEEVRGGNLNDRIAFLAGRQTTPDVLRGLTLIRTLGNNTLHTGSNNEQNVLDFLTEENGEIIQMLSGVLNMLVITLIAGPQRMEEMYNNLSAGVRERVELDVERFSESS